MRSSSPRHGLRGLLVSGLFGLVACSSSEDVTVDPGADGGVDGTADSGLVDTAAAETTPGDGSVDTSATDAADTGTPDGGTPDGGTPDGTPDGGTLDGGKPDATPETGTPDVGKPDVGKDTGPTGCSFDTDCRAYESYCASKDPCTCLPLGKDEPAPACPGGKTVTCFVAPCATQRAACVGGACVLVAK